MGKKQFCRQEEAAGAHWIGWYSGLKHGISKFYEQGCGAGTGTGRNSIHLETLEPEPVPYSEYGSGSGSEYKKMKQTTPKN